MGPWLMSVGDSYLFYMRGWSSSSSCAFWSAQKGVATQCHARVKGHLGAGAGIRTWFLIVTVIIVILISSSPPLQNSHDLLGSSQYVRSAVCTAKVQFDPVAVAFIGVLFYSILLGFTPIFEAPGVYNCNCNCILSSYNYVCIDVHVICKSNSVPFCFLMDIFGIFLSDPTIFWFLRDTYSDVVCDFT